MTLKYLTHVIFLELGHEHVYVRDECPFEWCLTLASPWVAGVKIAGGKLKMIRDKSHRVEKLLKDSSSMGRGGQGRRKENKWIQGRLGSKKDTTTIPWQRRQKSCWVF